MFVRAIVILCLLCFGVNGVTSTSDNNGKVSRQTMLQNALQSVVSISAYGEYTSPFMNDPFWQFFLSGRQSARTRACGSGFIFDANGYVATCWHVVENAKKIYVTLGDGRRFNAVIVRKDKALDLAVLKLCINDSEQHEHAKNRSAQLHALHFSARNILIGENVYAMGNSFGVGQTVTTGIVSATFRSFGGHLVHQTDAAINPGNSGGPIIDEDGCVVGMANSIASKTGGFHGVGFFIPVESLRCFVDFAINDIIPPILPFRTQTAEPSIVDALNDALFNEHNVSVVEALHGKHVIEGCVIVTSVNKSLKELREGDIILFINKIPVTSGAMCEFIAKTSCNKENNTYLVTYIRQDDLHTVKTCVVDAVIQTKKDIQNTTLTGKHALHGVVVTETALDDGELGVTVVEAPRGVDMVNEGDIIIRINEYPIKCLADVQEALRKTNQRGFSIVIKRGSMFIQQQLLR
ncbi:MAG: trypsin-like peptidase domain-containing protein [Holosporales bacterium]|jgi:S1-C subfamily serine protease|nr:trypsin-like peptidase domain-containing protein [Holosporales bacterium]